LTVDVFLMIYFQLCSRILIGSMFSCSPSIFNAKVFHSNDPLLFGSSRGFMTNAPYLCTNFSHAFTSPADNFIIF